MARLQRHGVLVAPVRRPDDTARSEQAAALRLIDDEDGMLISRSALSPNGTRKLAAAPALGEHTDEILADLGVATKEVRR